MIINEPPNYLVHEQNLLIAIVNKKTIITKSYKLNMCPNS